MISGRSINYSEISGLDRFTGSTSLFNFHLISTYIHSQTPLSSPEAHSRRKDLNMLKSQGESQRWDRAIYLEESHRNTPLSPDFLILSHPPQHPIKEENQFHYQSQPSNCSTLELKFSRYFYDWSTSMTMGQFEHFCLEKGKGKSTKLGKCIYQKTQIYNAICKDSPKFSAYILM